MLIFYCLMLYHLGCNFQINFINSQILPVILHTANSRGAKSWPYCAGEPLGFGDLSLADNPSTTFGTVLASLCQSHWLGQFIHSTLMHMSIQFPLYKSGRYTSYSRFSPLFYQLFYIRRKLRTSSFSSLFFLIDYNLLDLLCYFTCCAFVLLQKVFSRKYIHKIKIKSVRYPLYYHQ
jgi:hypothetical protein